MRAMGQEGGMSEQGNWNGFEPAFPCGPFGDTMHGEDGRQRHQFDRMPGMSLRDFFAAMALSNPDLVYTADSHNASPEERTAIRCYRMADAMLAERSKAK